MSARELQRPVSVSEPLEKRQEDHADNHITADPVHVLFDDASGGLEARKKLEKKLLLKIDLRMSVCITIDPCHINFTSHLCTRFS
jgi:hypothetical protein